MPIKIILLLLVLLAAGDVAAIDEDFYIPYTDTYGYVYDPETGKFVKKDQAAGEGQSNAPAAAAAGHGAGAKAPQAPPSRTAEQTSLPVVNDALEHSRGNAVFLLSGGGVLFIAGVLYWIRQKRRRAIFQ